MNYEVRVYDTWNRRIAVYGHVPLLKATRRAPDSLDTIEGILPNPVNDLSHGYRVEVFVDGAKFAEGTVTSVSPQWSDTRKLILERFVKFHEVIAFEAERRTLDANTRVRKAYTQTGIVEIVKDAINRALGPIHYSIDHTAYPDGAVWEFQKFSSRTTVDNELEVGGISQGQWVDSTRIDATGASAKDGDTIQGLVVDGVAWPDLRLMLIDSQETSINSHTLKLHPEVGTWSTAQYDASGYKLRADAATVFLQSLMDGKGIDFIELNPHRDASGQFDDRVDAFGRYLGLVYGGGECFNAAMVEEGHADVFLFDEGKFLLPELELKDFFSYTGTALDSIEDPSVTVAALDLNNGIFEVLTALAYASDGFVWSLSLDLAVGFRKMNRADRVVWFDPAQHSVTLGSDVSELDNALFFDGNPLASAFSKSYFNNPSIDEYGLEGRSFEYFSVSKEEDADKFAIGLLEDVAYPTPSGEVEFFNGDGSVAVGDVLEFRGGPLRRLEREVSGEWNDDFAGRLVGRVKEVAHRFLGGRVKTLVRLTSPIRSVDKPLSFIVRSQPEERALFQFRLDEPTVGLDLGFHLD